MQKIIEQNLPFVRQEIKAQDALKLFKKINQPYKVELIKDITKERAKTLKITKQKAVQTKVSIYRQNDFVDLCRGPHLASTGKINPRAFKLTKIAGAYWKGDEKRPMLQRIYGVAFETPKELRQYEAKIKEIEKRDHRKIGQDLDLFSIIDEVGAGLPLWHPKGAILRKVIEDYWKKEHQKQGYQYIYTPHIGRLDLWKKSGHWDFYRENMYSPIEIDKERFLLKPMNCPFHVQIFKHKLRSYKDLPIRLNELGTVYRYERAGTLHGLLRVRGFTQDDAHIFCSPDQIQEEIEKLLDFTFDMLADFGFKDFKIELSLRDPKAKKKYLGSDKIWHKAEHALAAALKSKKLKYEEAPGEAVFYGPKIDTKLVDSLGRNWQGPTIQLDFNFPEKFNLNFINEQGEKEQVAMIHRTILGSLERFIALLLEENAGTLPCWLSPVQVLIIPVSDKYINYAKKIEKEIKENSIRCEFDDRPESVGKKISDSIKQKIPYVLVIGEAEMKTKKLPVRSRDKKKIIKMELEKFIDKVKGDSPL